MLEARIEQEARRLGVSKSEFVKDAIERVLGLKDPAELLKQVRSGTPIGAANTSAHISRPSTSSGAALARVSERIPSTK